MRQDENLIAYFCSSWSDVDESDKIMQSQSGNMLHSTMYKLFLFAVKRSFR